METATLANRVFERHTTYYLHLVQQAEEQWERIDACYAQIQRAWRHASRTTVLHFVEALAHYQEHRGLWQDRRNYLQRALTLVEQNRQETQLIQLTLKLGYICRQQGQLDDAFSAFTEVWRLCDLYADDQARADALRGFGFIHFYRGEYAQAIEKLQHSLQWARTTKNHRSEGAALNGLGAAYQYKGEWTNAVALYKEAIQLLQEQGDRFNAERTMGNLGKVYLQLGRWDESLAIFEIALASAREFGERRGESSALTEFGVIYTELKRWDEAEVAFLEALQMQREIGDPVNEQYSVIGLGNLYRQQRKWDDSQRLLELGHVISQKLGTKWYGGKALMFLGLLQADQHQPVAAIALLQEALSHFQAVKANHDCGVVLLYLGNTYAQLGNQSSATTFWREALNMLHPESPEYRALHERIVNASATT